MTKPISQALLAVKRSACACVVLFLLHCSLTECFSLQNECTRLLRFSLLRAQILASPNGILEGAVQSPMYSL